MIFLRNMLTYLQELLGLIRQWLPRGHIIEVIVVHACLTRQLLNAMQVRLVVRDGSCLDPVEDFWQLLFLRVQDLNGEPVWC